MKLIKSILWIATLCFSAIIFATEENTPKVAVQKQKIVDIYAVDEKGAEEKLGTIRIVVTKYGLLFQPDLQGLVPGLHGFHIHEFPSCMPGEDEHPASAAGSHYDPAHSDYHGGPYGEGHLGDLPPLYVDVYGNAKNEVLAPRLHTIKEVTGRSIMIHAGGDNFADYPEKLGGGGARVACGVIQ